jgi:hypothetical protein
MPRITLKLDREYRQRLIWRAVLTAWLWTQFLPLWPDAWPRVATPSRVQAATSSHSSTTSGGTSLGNTAAGNLLVVLISRNGIAAGVTVSGISDGTNTYVQAVGSTERDGRNTEIWYAKNIAALTTPTVTTTMSGTTGWRQWVIEVANCSVTTPLDTSSSYNTGTGTTSLRCSSAGITTTTDVIVFCVSVTTTAGQTFTAGSGYTLESATGTRNGGQYQISAGGLSSNQGLHSCTASTNFTACMASFKADAGGAAYSLSASQGAFSLTGQAAGLKRGSLVVANQGAISLTGQASGLSRTALIAASQGAYSLLGQGAGLEFGRLLVAAQGAYLLSGQDVALRKGRTVIADTGVFTLSGQDAAFRWIHVLIASSGTYAYSGQAAGLRATRALSAAAGGFVLSGQVAGFVVARVMPAATGAYALTGQAATFVLDTDREPVNHVRLQGKIPAIRVSKVR